MSARRFGLLLAGLAALLLLAAAFSLSVGSSDIPAERVAQILWGGGDSLQRSILLDLRLPRILLSILVGAGLAVAGAAYQGIFLNPLADPFVIGASSGAALGATLAILSGGEQAARVLPLAAFSGALAAVGAVYLLGRQGGPLGLLLAGAAASTTIGSLVSLLMVLHDQSLGVLFHWLLGGFATSGWSEIRLAAPVLVVGMLALWALSRPLDALALGDETAATLGLNAGRLRLAIVVLATVITASAVAAAGIIGFVGLMAPHAARFLAGSRAGRLLPASCLVGALLLLLADDAARTLAPPQEVPVSIITALLGGPSFLVLLGRARRKGAGR